MILNITIAGRSTEHELDIDPVSTPDDDFRQLACEIRSIPADTLNSFIVDRVNLESVSDAIRVYVRPQVPFGSDAPKKRDDRSLIARMAANIMSGTPLAQMLHGDGSLRWDTAALGAVNLARAILTHIDETSS